MCQGLFRENLYPKLTDKAYCNYYKKKYNKNNQLVTNYYYN